MSGLASLQSGEALKSIELAPVTRMDLIKYSGASGDFNPIHTIDAEAEKAGLPGIIAHGMWTMGNLSKLFTPYLEAGFIENFTIRFSGMLFLNDVVTLKAELNKQEENQLIFRVAAENQHEKKIIKGTVTFQLYEEV